jgi:acetylornithine/N-succinyldiaminopimelate aminotransferase
VAKGLANGLPIGALLVADEVAGAFAPGDHGSTFGGNPVAAAAACAVVEAVDDELLANVHTRGSELVAGLRGLPVTNVRGRGLLVGFETAAPAGDVVEAARNQGLLVLTAGERVVRLAPPLTVSQDEVTAALAVLAQVVTLRP